MCEEDDNEWYDDAGVDIDPAWVDESFTEEMDTVEDEED